MPSPAAKRVTDVHHGRFTAWLSHHAQSVATSLGRLLRRPWATLLTVGVMALALALPLGLWVAVNNVQRLDDQVQSARALTVFLKTDVDAAQAQALAGTLRQRPDVAAVAVVTPEQSLARLRERADLAQAIDALGPEQARAALPSLLELTPRAAEAPLVQALQVLPQVERVQYDARWQQRLRAWLVFGSRAVAVLAAMLGLGMLLVVGNTVRLDIQSRREEISVLQLLGASDGYVQRPFLYLGAWYGLAAGAVALGVLTLAGMALAEPLSALASRYGSGFALHGIGPIHAGIVLVSSTVLGWMGAALVSGHYLRQTRPLEH